MSTVKISQLPEITHLNTNTDDTLVVGVDTQTGVTGKITVTTLAEGLYSNNALKVGSNQVQGANVIAQFTGNSSVYLQTVIQNFDANGSSDIVAATSDSDDVTRYVDMGINGSEFADPAYSAMKPYDAYLYSIGETAESQTGNLVIGTGSTDADIVLIAGGTEEANIVGRIRKTSFDFYANVVATGNIKTEGNYIFADLSTQDVAAAPANYTQSAFDKANTASANTILSQGTNTWQNTQITQVNQYAAAGFAQSNTNTTAITQIQNVDATQNTNITAVNGYAFSAYAYANTNANNIVLVNQFAGGAYAKANAALANATGTFAGDLTVTGNVTILGLANTTVNNLNVTKNVTVNGTMVLANSNFLSTESAVTISATPTVAVPSNDGYMLHISGKEGVPSRIVFDSYGSGAYGLVAGRTARGTVASPTAVANNDVLMRISGNGHGGAGAGWTTTGVARIDIVATENYSTTNRGSQIQFWNVPIGSNTLQQIATFNGDSVHFTGVVNPEKGFVFTPNVISSNVTTHTVNFATDSLKKLQINNDCTVTLSNYVAGKVVEVWVTNLSGSNRTFTHGVSALNSTNNSATATIPATSSAYFRYFSIDGDLANTFVTVVQG